MKIAVVCVSALLLVGAAAPSGAATADVDSCLLAASTQSEMSQCTGMAYSDARRELDRVLQRIRTSYAGYSDFLSALVASQDAWQRSFDADLEMLYPGPDKQHRYGTVYAMCAGLDRIGHTLARVEYLK
jgi:uncharacterized protein YecT (DUF1311 family)